MRRKLLAACTGVASVLGGGCLQGPLLDNPLHLQSPAPAPAAEATDNSLYVPLGPLSYGKVFETTYSTLSEYFEVKFSDRYGGVIQTYPKVSPGLEQPWRPGSPDASQRLEATLQTIRRRAEVFVQPADDGGHFVQVWVYKELEDLPRPSRPTAGAAAFRSSSTVERTFEVIDPSVYESSWIPRGRDHALEQEILRRLKTCM